MLLWIMRMEVFSESVSDGREAALSPVCQLTLPVTDCLPLIHTLTLPVSKEESEKKWGATKKHMILSLHSFYFCL